jgi:hypothetical protein
MANPKNPSEKQRGGGMGQSGYTAGRQVDPAVERHVDTRRVGSPGSDGLGTDERFTGRGGLPAADEDPDNRDDRASQPARPHAQVADLPEEEREDSHRDDDEGGDDEEDEGEDE